MPIKYPIKKALGANVNSFPAVQQEKIIEIIDELNKPVIPGVAEDLAQTLTKGRVVDATFGTILTNSGEPSVDFNARTLRSTDGFVTETIINWFDQKIFSLDSAANGPVIDWALCLLNETIAGNINPSLDWTQRRTYDGNGNLPINTSFNWASRRLFDSINGDTGSDLGTAINWGDRQAYSQDGELSLGWENRTLNGGAGYAAKWGEYDESGTATVPDLPYLVVSAPEVIIPGAKLDNNTIGFSLEETGVGQGNLRITIKDSTGAVTTLPIAYF